MKQPDKADEFAYYWNALAPASAPQPEREYRFSFRKYRFDFAWPKMLVAVEIDGGTLMIRNSKRTGRPVVIGRHNLDADREKGNSAATRGWRILHYTPAMLHKDPSAVIEQVCMALTNGHGA